ncbi:hypothetical protein NWP96_02435 [Mycoplasmopsis cynos]|nr:hypothetical protein [Mycoplasmopsis cynos]
MVSNTWINPDENDRKNNQFAKNSNTKKNNHGNVFSGIGYFNLKEKDYFIFSTPKKQRRDGSLYIADKTFNDVVEVFDYDFSNKNQEEHFVYSYALTIRQTNEYVDVVVVYESSSKTKIPDNKQPHDSDRTLIWGNSSW